MALLGAASTTLPNSNEALTRTYLVQMAAAAPSTEVVFSLLLNQIEISFYDFSCS